MVLGFGAGSIFTGSSDQPAPSASSETVPQENVETVTPWPLLGGGSIVLADYKDNKSVVLDFWASWCPNCQRDMPVLNRLYEKYKEDIEVIGVNLQEENSTISNFISSTGIDFPIVLDPLGTIAQEYRIQYTNVHVLIDKKGNVTKVIPGDIQEADIIELIEGNTI